MKTKRIFTTNFTYTYAEFTEKQDHEIEFIHVKDVHFLIFFSLLGKESIVLRINFLNRDFDEFTCFETP